MQEKKTTSVNEKRLTRVLLYLLYLVRNRLEIDANSNRLFGAYRRIEKKHTLTTNLTIYYTYIPEKT